LRSGAHQDFAIFQDADLEYDPNDYRPAVPLLAGQADVVFERASSPASVACLSTTGTRSKPLPDDAVERPHDLNLTDMETCYKIFRTEILKTIPIRSNGFGIERAHREGGQARLRVYEVPVSYEACTSPREEDHLARRRRRSVRPAREALSKRCLPRHARRRGSGGASDARRFNHRMAATIRPCVGDRVLEIGAGIGNSPLMLLPVTTTATDVDKHSVSA
jgi:predicted O-methyltransferase YrrM